MSNVRAGVAYVDLRLGSADKLIAGIKREVESAAALIGKRVGDTISKNVPKSAGEEIGKVTSRNMSKAFFKDAGQSFTAGFRALSQGQFRVFGRFMQEAGVAGALGIRTGFEGGLKSFGNRVSTIFKSVITTASDAGVAIARGVNKGLQEIEKGLTSLSQKVGLASFQIMNLGFIMSTAFTAPVAAIVTLGTIIGVKTAAQIEQATASLKALTPAGTNVEALVKRLQRLAQESPIFNTVDVITFTQKMVASGLTVQQTERFLKSFGNIALTVGADISKIPFALEALVQMVGKGKVSMEELRLQLGDALPGAMKIVADALGVTQTKLYDLVKAGKVTGIDVVKALTKLGQSGKYLKGANVGADTLQSKFQQLKETVVNQLGNVFLTQLPKIKDAVDKIGPSLAKLIDNSGPVFSQLVDGFGKLVEKLNQLVEWYTKLDPKQQDMVKKLILIAAVAGPVVIALGAFFGALAGIAAGVALFANPVGLVIVLVTALAAGFTFLWKTSDKFRAKVKELWDDFYKYLVGPLKGPIKDAIDGFKEAWDQVMNALGQKTKDGKRDLTGFYNFLKGIVVALSVPMAIFWGVIRGVLSAIGPLFRAIGSLISGIVKIFRGVIETVRGIAEGDWKRVLKGLELLWDGLWDAIVGTIWNAIQVVINLVKGLVTGIVDFFKWLFDILVGHSIIPDMVNAIISWFKKLLSSGTSIIGSLGSFFKSFYNNYIAPFVNAVRDGFNRVVDVAKEIPGKIKGVFSGAIGWLKEAGKDIMRGLINGIEGMGSAVGSAAASAAKKAVGIVNNALGIHSPSRVFEEIGRFVVQGFIEGIDAMTPKLESAMGVFDASIPNPPKPEFGSPANPLMTANSAAPKAALNIENYNVVEPVDPKRQAEDWYFIVSARGGNA